MVDSQKKGMVHVHLATLLFGGTALFAKWITLPADVITFWRTAVAMLCIWVICRLRGQSLRLERLRDVWIQIGLGCIFGIHWVTYYGAIQHSTVAIGITALFTAPIMSILIGAVLLKRWPDAVDLCLGGAVLFGVYFLSPNWSWQDSHTHGVVLGLISAVFLALRQVLHTRTRARNASGLVLLLYQLIGIAVCFAFSGLTAEADALQENALRLVLLGVCFTALPHFLNLSALRVLEAKTVLIITSLMVPYGMLLSALFLGEIPTARTLVGCCLIMCAATVENLRVSGPQWPRNPPLVPVRTK